MIVKIKALDDQAIMPTYATPGSACFDLYAIEGGVHAEKLIVRTGLAFEIPEGHVMLVYSRSGMGIKTGIRLSNCVGVIDSDYRGEVRVALSSDNFCLIEVKPGDRIAQAMIVPYPKVTLMMTEVLSSTERGEGGFGSTGK